MSAESISTQITQTIGTVYGGLVAGTYIAQQIVQAAVAPPRRLKTVRRYLEAVSEVRPGQEIDPHLAGIMDLPFRADIPGAGQPQPLYQVIDDTLEQARCREGSQRLVLLGETGAGKTPALLGCLRTAATAALALLDARGLGPDDESVPTDLVIPVYLTSTALCPGQPLEGRVLDTFNDSLPKGEPPISSETLAQLLAGCRFRFFVDNLEDLLAAAHRDGLQELSAFIETHRTQSYVIGCRTSSYHEQLGPLQSLYLANLTVVEVKNILDGIEPGLFARIQNNPTALAVARNRSMLERFILTREAKYLLQTRASLLQARSRELIDPDSDGWTNAGLDRRMIEGLLEALALHIRRAHARHYTPRQLMDLVSRYLEDWRLKNEWGAIVQALVKDHVLQWDDTEQGCGFADRKVEDYYAAAALAHDPAALQHVLGEASDYWWRDVFEILVGLVSNPRALLLDLVDRDALVAANCLPYTASAVGASVGDAIIDALVEQMGHESTARRKFIVERLAESGHPRAPEALLMALKNEWSSAVVLPAVRALRSWYEEHPGAIEAAENSIRLQLASKGQYITRLIRLFDRDAPPEKVAVVARRMKQSRQPALFRGIAAVGLGLMGTPDARDHLLGTLADRFLDEFVAWCAAEALTLFKDPIVEPVHVRLLELLRSGDYCKPPWEQERARWVYLLGWLGRGSETGERLLVALRDPAPVVRGRAIQAMAQLDRIDARESIELLLTTDPHPYVQRKAAEALAQVGTLDSLPVLERSLNRERSGARLAFRHSIAAIKLRYGIP